MSQVIGSTVGGSSGFGYISIELNAGEVSEPFILTVVPGSTFRAWPHEALFIEGRVDGVGPWSDLSDGLDLSAEVGDVSVEVRVTASRDVVGVVMASAFLGVVNSGQAAWAG